MERDLHLITDLPLMDAITQTQEAKILDSLRPGQVLLVTNDQISEDVPTNNRSALVLSGVCAVFDADGDFSGSPGKKTGRWNQQEKHNHSQ